jgi:ribosomal protein S21
MSNLTFLVRDHIDIDLAKKFTRACLKQGLPREIRPRRFVPPSMARRLKSKVARAKIAKADRRRAASEAAWLKSRGQADE